MGREKDERPEIEVLGPAGSTAPPTVVQRGGPGRDPSRRTVLAAVVVVAVLIAAGFALGDGGGNGEQAEASSSTTSTTRPTTTTRPTSTTAPTTTTVVTGPVLESRTGALLVSAGPGHWEVVDLDTGTHRDVDLGPPEDGYSGLGVRNGVVLVSGARTTTYWDVRQDPPVSKALGVADQAFPSSSPDEVWLVDTNGYAMSNAGDAVNTARLVGLDGSVRRSFDLGSSVYALGVTDGGVVTQGGGRLFLADEHGSRALAVGEGMTTTTDSVIARTCDASARCGVVLIDVATGRTRSLPTNVDAPGGLQVASATADEIAFVVYGNQGSAEMWVVDGQGRALAHDDTQTVNNPPVALPDGQGWVLLTPGGSVERLVRRGSAITHTPLEGLDDLTGQVILVTRS